MENTTLWVAMQVRKKHPKLSSNSGRTTKLLKVATPRDENLKFLRREGLIAPDEVDPENDAVAFDFTRLTGRQVGAVHSRYAVRHAHAIYVAARRASRLIMLKRDLKIEYAVQRSRNKGKYKNKWELDDELLVRPEIQRLEKDIAVIEAELEIINAVAAGYEGIRNGASREMYRRGSEQAPRHDT